MASKTSAARAAAQPQKNGGVRTTIAVQGARVHNLKNISVEIPRDSLVVVTGLSGSGKSSLAFDTIYAEGQRRYMESLSSYAKRFVAQVAKPDVDFVFGLSPVISIEQKTVGSNPRSTVGTMTDIASYLNLLFATIGQPHCPRTGEPAPSRTASQILEAILALPEGTEIELRAPIFKVYGEDLNFVFTEVRKKGCRRLIVDGKPIDISDETDLEASDVEHMDAVVDRFVVRRAHEKAIRAGIASTLLVGDGLLQVQIVKGASKAEAERFYQGLCSRDAPLRLRRHRPRVLHVQQPGERLPHLRRPRRGQAHASGPAGARYEAQHRRRLFREGGLPLQPRDLGRHADVQPVEGARLLAGQAVEGSARARPQGDSLRHRAEEDRAGGAARRQGHAREVGGQGDRIRRHRAPHRTLVPPLPAARRGQFADGAVARQGDGGAHLPGLQRHARAAPRGCCSRSAARRSTTSGSCTSTSCTPSSARSSRPAAAPPPGARSSAKSATGSSCCSGSASTT